MNRHRVTFLLCAALTAFAPLGGCTGDDGASPADTGDGSAGPSDVDMPDSMTGASGTGADGDDESATPDVTDGSGGGAGDPGAEPAGAAGSASSGDSGRAGAGAGAGNTDGTVPATFETLQSVITQAPCFGAGCHNDDQNPLDLRMDQGLLARLTSSVSTNCGEMPVVNPGKPEQSALVQLLKGPCGTTPRMPIGCVNDGDGSCVPPEYIAAIEQWIAAGAEP